MSKYHLTGALSVVLCAGLSACSTSHDGQAELSQKTVQYECSGPAQQDVDLNVQYTFQNDQPVEARVMYNGQAITLMRDTRGKADMVGETFVGSGYAWTTGTFTYDNVDDVDGNMLTQINGSQNTSSDAILVKNCEVD